MDMLASLDRKGIEEDKKWIQNYKNLVIFYAI